MRFVGVASFAQVVHSRAELAQLGQAGQAGQALAVALALALLEVVHYTVGTEE